mmetsp:Transcript_19528/g.35712  ORF Transcript_19528/g.35712 Transcript_19528/m.35712 type:complete len:120 (+) Transcript_19528:4023-4382(+)
MELATDSEVRMSLPMHTFITTSSWCELPGGVLYFTGGYRHGPSDEVVIIDTRRDFALTHKLPMLVRRNVHTAVFRLGYLYVFGGNEAESFTAWERLKLYANEETWEVLLPLPQVCIGFR